MQDRTFDKKDNREYSREEQIERYKQYLAKVKTYKQKSFRKGKILINNGVEQKWILCDMPIPEGYKRGALK